MALLPPSFSTDPVTWNLHGTELGEKYVAFQDYVRPEQTHRVDCSFPHILQLPVELQQRVIYFCDCAVLYQLMHTSKAMRNEAKKLFWSDPTARYLVEGPWLLAGGFSGHTLSDVDALACMTYIKVDFRATGPFAYNAWEDGIPKCLPRPTNALIERQTRRFWQTLQRCFPRVTDVVLHGFCEIHAGTVAPADFAMLAEGCPSTISTSLSCVHQVEGFDKRLKQSLWRRACLESGHSAAWVRMNEPDGTQPSVMPPPKPLRGPVGTFCRVDYNRRWHYYLHCARPLLLLQATEAYYMLELQVPCLCPAPGCNLRFERAGEWTVHAIDQGHSFDLAVPPSERQQALFAKHAALIARIKQQNIDILTGLRNAWGVEGSKQRAEAEKAFLEQLEHDPLYKHEKPPKDCALWQRYQDEMNEND